MPSYSLDDPDVIRAKGEAEARMVEARAKLMEARSKLSPSAQAIYAFWEGMKNFLSELGCLMIILLLIVLIFGAPILGKIFD